MKKNIGWGVVVLLLLCIPSLLAVSTSNSPQVKISLQSQSPDPVKPGEIVTIKIKVENDGAPSTEDIIVRIVPQAPFSIYRGAAEKNIGKIRATKTAADAEIVQFELKVDENAVEQETELVVQMQSGGTLTTYDNDQFLIDIETRDAILDIVSITTDPEEITPGEKADISIVVKNLADSLLRDIKLKMDLSSSSIPLAPYQSSSQRSLGVLQSDFQTALHFSVIAEPDAVPGLYKVPLNISYTDEQGRSFSINEILAISIGGSPKIKPYIKKSSVLQSKKAGKITIEIANAGPSPVKFLEIKFLPSDDYQLVSTSDYIYIGDVDSDDTESEEIDIFVNAKNKMNIPVQLSYYDPSNKEWQQSFDLNLPLYSSRELKKFGIISGGNGWIFIVIILLGGGGYFYYKRYYKKRKKD